MFIITIFIVIKMFTITIMPEVEELMNRIETCKEPIIPLDEGQRLLVIREMAIG